MAKTAKAEVGAAAPDFELPGTGGRTYRLSDFRGSNVLVVFYPGDETPVCTKQLSAYSANLERFNALGAKILAVSTRNVASKQRFLDHYDFRFPLLADEKKEAARAYGVAGPFWIRRAIFLIDREGVIRWKQVAPVFGITYTKTDDLLEKLKEIA